MNRPDLAPCTRDLGDVTCCIRSHADRAARMAGDAGPTGRVWIACHDATTRRTASPARIEPARSGRRHPRDSASARRTWPSPGSRVRLALDPRRAL